MNKPLLLLALVASSVAAYADDMFPTDNFTLRGDATYTSKYVFRGLQEARESFEPTAELTMGDFYGGVLSNIPLDAGQKSEVDFYGARHIALPELGPDWKFELGGYAYYFPQGYYTPGLSNTSFEAYAGLYGGKVLGGVMPSIYTYYDFTRRASTTEGALKGSLPLTPIGLSLDGIVTLGYVEADHSPDYAYCGAGLSVPFQLTKKATLHVGGQYTGNDLTGAEHRLFYYSAGIMLTF